MVFPSSKFVLEAIRMRLLQVCYSKHLPGHTSATHNGLSSGVGLEG